MKRWMIVVLVVVVLVVAVIGIGILRQGQAVAAQFASLQTETAAMGSLQATVGATGSVRANQSANLVWQSNGAVGVVFGEVGQRVSTGDILAELRQTSLPQNIILAEADLVSAQQALEDLQAGVEPTALARAAQTLADAEKAADAARRTLNGVTTPANQSEIDSARATVVLTEDRLDKARDAFAPYENKADSVIKANLQTRLSQAQQEYDAAVRRYNNLTGSASALDVAKAQADLDLALAQLADAQTDYDELLAGVSAEDIAAAEARVAAAQATLNLALISAPFDGIVTQAQPQVGDLVSAGTPAFRLDDLSRLLVDVSVSEIDINRIAVDQPVTVTFDAILAKEYEGRVVEVGIVGTDTQGIVSFSTTVELLNPDEDVKPGMTAAVNIVVTQLDNVLLVPNRAVRVQDGQRIVNVLRNNLLETVKITLGASSENYSEVAGGDLQVGDVIVLNPPTNFFAGGPFGGPGGGQP